uniref:Uncharacterized protein n=1 Tax=Ralstonia solanacearum TaxID=305 RepID=A0A0S4V1K6_RALSL|nr:protein of unknown function [Ralstonia solanacearum]CUV28284.1 protein of unknown function [Ralstonia solanacearum]CUV43178.1 protein of unknown function [Ralstonia solanacearum]CUV63800.1 protein of unknown function [Ralstonia solanacearum]
MPDACARPGRVAFSIRRTAVLDAAISPSPAEVGYA